MLVGVLFTSAFAFLNRARGSKLFDQTTSTTVARLVSTFFMALLVLLVSVNWPAAAWAWVALFLWAVPEWGKYMGAACGNRIDSTEKGFILSEWVLACVAARDSRVRGLIGTAVRMALAAPCVAGVGFLTGGAVWPASLTPFMAVPYFWLSYFLDSGRSWKYGEYAAGALLGAALWLAIAS
ncbi:hypothetical protein J8F10_08825 [Gemmata sp. G18]|uniref:Phosphatidate cytidylyltransferase n=1 Tax=Gemmata palustris TaxID=2822762 RepID=A0ABS5BNX1_9BACT|nr:hypothetical protein [Gemmata palustris]MBP3955382.1 hypothetical protein [Gemmata palustris]